MSVWGMVAEGGMCGLMIRMGVNEVDVCLSGESESQADPCV